LVMFILRRHHQQRSKVDDMSGCQGDKIGSFYKKSVKCSKKFKIKSLFGLCLKQI
jgi:hypothetical protein